MAERHDNRAKGWRWMALAVPALALIGSAVAAGAANDVRRGAAAFGDWRDDAPGVRRLITPADLPPPYATEPAASDADIIARPAKARLHVPPGFRIEEFASGLSGPRLLRVAPNGDLFVVESRRGRIKVIEAAGGTGKAGQIAVFTEGLDRPFGLAFYPPGADPEWVYVANTGSVVRFPYRSGDRKARGPAATVVRRIPGGGSLHGGGHWTRDLVFSADGKRMFVSVGSRSNDGEDMGGGPPGGVASWEATHGTGAAWGPEEHRADVLAFSPEGGEPRVFATGIRNCVGMAIEPATGELWCSTNERDGLGDDLVPDYLTRVREGGFYGWPWFYLGGDEDPNHAGKRPDLKSRVIVPDVLIQSHSAPMQMEFYTGRQFPAEYRGSAFAALHGSWNRSRRTGYKIVRAILKDGRPTGEYEDFVTGFVPSEGKVWGRPVGIAVAGDGALLFSDDANGTIWRVTYEGDGRK
jgi:hypothetical protein